MRITHLTQIIRGHGGVQRVLREVLGRQADRGHDVRLIAIGDSELEDDLGLRADVAVSWFTTTGNVAVPYSHAPGLLSHVRAEARTPGIFHAHQHFAPPTLLAATTRAPKVLTPYLHVPASVSRVAEARRRWQLRVVARRYRGGLVFLCESERHAFEDLAHMRLPEVDIVPPGVSMPVDDGEPYEKDRPVVLVVARIVRAKQIDRVVESVAASARRPRLVVVGNGPALAELQLTCRRCGLDVERTLLGSVDDAALRRWYHTADVVASLSREESFGLTLLEAASVGAALLVSDIPAHHDALELCGDRDREVVGVDSDIGVVAAALDKLLDRRGERSVERQPLRTWDDMVEDLDRVYRRVLDKAGR